MSAALEEAPPSGGARRLKLAAGSASEAMGDRGLEACSPDLTTQGRCIQCSTSVRRRCVCAHCPIPLAANAGRVVTREEILDTLWGTDYVAESNVVDRQIRNLRTRLQDDWRRPRFIATVPGKGYRFLPTFTDATAGAMPDPSDVPAAGRRG